MIIETCFDWMISDEKVAIHAYSMQILFNLGKENNWIHTELKQILVDNLAFRSKGYVVRAKKNSPSYWLSTKRSLRSVSPTNTSKI